MVVQRQVTSVDHRFSQEWLVTNGLGGYASGTVSGVLTRRYHGYLVAALPNPHGRTMMFNYLVESLALHDGTESRLTSEEREDCALQPHGACFLSDFRLEMGLPVWDYWVDDVHIEKRVFLRYRQNTVQLTYRILSAESPVQLRLAPAVHFRPHSSPVAATVSPLYSVQTSSDKYEISEEKSLPTLRLLAQGPRTTFTIDKKTIEALIYRVEHGRGYKNRDTLWSPGFLDSRLSQGEEITLVASTEPWEVVDSLSVAEARKAELDRRRLLCERAREPLRTGIGSDLLLAADQFIFRPVARWKDVVRTHASGDSPRSVIAGYHWFTDWGRDSMISLEGLALITGRHNVAGWILRTFARYTKDGLIPNLFPEQEEEGRYNTADATLWMFHALGRYLEATGDRTTIRLLLPQLEDIVALHKKGTRFGIGVDPEDGLVRQGQEGYALTWMDAKVGDLVVTPRRGKAVEINALWYNALKLLEDWLSNEGETSRASTLAKDAERVRESFNRKFWYEEGGYLFDVIDGPEGNDDSCRPNQLFSMSLAHAVLDRSLWPRVLNVIEQRLMTPYGLRTLAPGQPGYQRCYAGDIISRDMAYHQGTVWPWLIGHYIDARLKLRPEDKQAAAKSLEPLLGHFREQACLGSISEVFDSEEPFSPGGCVAQAWSVAEVLRAWVKTNQ